MWHQVLLHGWWAVPRRWLHDADATCQRAASANDWGAAGGKNGKSQNTWHFFCGGLLDITYHYQILVDYWWIIGGWLVDDWIFWIIARFLSLLWYVYVCPHRMFLGTCSENTYYLRLVDDEKIAAVELPKSFDPCIAMKSIGSYPLVN